MIAPERKRTCTHFLNEDMFIDSAAKVGIGIEGADADNRCASDIIAYITSAGQTTEVQCAGTKHDAVTVNTIGVEQPMSLGTARFRYIKICTGGATTQLRNKRACKATVIGPKMQTRIHIAIVIECTASC